jgi:FKBP-type peptidyl-prolyl cis-trans isomerase
MPSQSKGPRSSTRQNGARPKSTTRTQTPPRKAATSTPTTPSTATGGTATATATKARPATQTAAKPVVRGAATERLSKREARAALRAAERRRRNTIISTVAAVLVVGALVLLLKDHLPRSSSPSRAAASTASACPATPTAVTGPASPATPALHPPALPTGAKTVSGDQGLQYVDINPGCGRAVQAGDNVLVNYTGWLQSTGAEFDSSIGPGKTPFEVDNVGQAQVIQGWNMGLVGMKLGSTRRLIIPAALGYGSAGSPPVIPPNATLVFDITVVGFK